MKPGSLTHWCQTHAGRLVGLVLGSVLLAWGAYNCVAGLAPPVPYSLSVTAVEAGQPLPGRWLELTGRLLREDRIIWSGDETHETYVPLVTAEWQPGQAVAVFVRAREDIWGQPGRLLQHEEPTVRGFVDRARLDPDLGKRFTEFEMPPRADAIVVDYEGEPSTQTLTLGYVEVAAGGVILLLTAVVWLITWLFATGQSNA